MKRILPFLLILAVLGAALGSAWYLTRSMPASTPANSASASPDPQGATTQPVANKGVPGAEPANTRGPANAPAQLEEFGDFQCPPCGIFHPILEQMEQEFGDKLRVTFREFPLVPAHRHALIAASAAEAAGAQGKFWEMHKMIFDHQKDWKDSFDSRPTFEGYAKEIGLDVERYKRDLESDAIAQRIFLDGKRGYSLGVKGTPTLFLNDREVPFETLIQADKLRVVIQKEIESARK
ncbi:MAG TPA: thioredoxin domain-containing protein [Pyrinomonadaceae bacterium]|jgi:protein-disulfide isomerase|nr:thioredoxin domain-containing protein [Pyrinomonadaceae bacterium]